MPFESMGVDTTWEFQMPKAANQFDYRTIADVLFTIGTLRSIASTTASRSSDSGS